MFGLRLMGGCFKRTTAFLFVLMLSESAIAESRAELQDQLDIFRGMIQEFSTAAERLQVASADPETLVLMGRAGPYLLHRDALTGIAQVLLEDVPGLTAALDTRHPGAAQWFRKNWGFTEGQLRSFVGAYATDEIFDILKALEFRQLQQRLQWGREQDRIVSDLRAVEAAILQKIAALDSGRATPGVVNRGVPPGHDPLQPIPRGSALPCEGVNRENRGEPHFQLNGANFYPYNGVYCGFDGGGVSKFRYTVYVRNVIKSFKRVGTDYPEEERPWVEAYYCHLPDKSKRTQARNGSIRFRGSSIKSVYNVRTAEKTNELKRDCNGLLYQAGRNRARR